MNMGADLLLDGGLDLIGIFSLIDDLCGVPLLGDELTCIATVDLPVCCCGVCRSCAGRSDLSPSRTLPAAMPPLPPLCPDSRRKRAADEVLSVVDLCARDMDDDAGDEARKVRRMARNRRAAAGSRARKKEHVELLQGHIDELKEANVKLQRENTEMKRRLRDAWCLRCELGDGASGDAKLV